MTADPCPWCGDEAVEDAETLFPDGLYAEHEAMRDARCASCGRLVWVVQVVDVRYEVKKFGNGKVEGNR